SGAPAGGGGATKAVSRIWPRSDGVSCASAVASLRLATVGRNLRSTQIPDAPGAARHCETTSWHDRPDAPSDRRSGLVGRPDHDLVGLDPDRDCASRRPVLGEHRIVAHGTAGPG